VRADYFLGLDLGQSHDPTAVAILERAEEPGEWDAVRWAHRVKASLRLRYLERMPLGTPYPEVAERVVAMTESEALRERCAVMVDATGVGRPVVDLLRRAGLSRRMYPAIVTNGHAETVDRGYYHVPKRDLIAGLQVALQQGEIAIAAGMPYWDALVGELMSMRVRVTAKGHEQFGAWREGEHDDLVFALALAYWGVRKKYPGGEMGERWWTREGRVVGPRREERLIY
jgi:hypothetical protein